MRHHNYYTEYYFVNSINQSVNQLVNQSMTDLTEKQINQIKRNKL